jgi:hypothetical protein
MTIIKAIPYGWACSIEDCPAGAFVPVDGVKTNICFKTEYGNNEAYNCAGEYYHGKGLVQPIIFEECEE